MTFPGRGRGGGRGEGVGYSRSFRKWLLSRICDGKSLHKRLYEVGDSLKVDQWAIKS